MPILEGRVGTSPLRADVEHAESSCPHRCETRAANWAGMPPPGMILICFAVISGIRPAAKQSTNGSACFRLLRRSEVFIGGAPRGGVGLDPPLVTIPLLRDGQLVRGRSRICSYGSWPVASDSR